MNEATFHNSRHVLGIPEMDAQHSYLYSLFDRIEQAGTVTSPDAMRVLLTEMEGYIVFHFSSEEHLMRMYKFPGFGMHTADHEAAASKFVNFLNDFDNSCLNPNALRIFLTGWLMDHSLQSDSEYAAWITTCRGKIPL